MPSDSGDHRRPPKPQQAPGGAPPPEQEHLPCPRCDSTNTKFCYYNNYNFSQPRHFCKSCRRYWTHGGTLRDIPVGGGSRKNAKRSRTCSSSSSTATSSSSHDPLPATPVFMSLAAGAGAGVPFGGDIKPNVNMAGSFTSLLNNTQGPGFLALGGFGLGVGAGFEDVGFGVARGVWPFTEVGFVAAAGGNGGAAGGGGVIGNTWQLESGEGGQAIGVNYGLQGDNLPTPLQVMALCKSHNISRVRIFSPNSEVLGALQNQGIELVLGTGNADLPALGRDPNFAIQWVHDNVKKYVPYINFRYIVIGDEVIPGEIGPAVLLAAMQNLKTALQEAHGLYTPVTMSVYLTVLSYSNPPSISQFSAAAIAILAPIIRFLEANKYPLLCHVYPYSAYIADPNKVRLDYTLFNATEVVVVDGKLGYKNLFDAMVDSMYWALQKAGGPNVEVVVSESGWPSAGGGNMAAIQWAEVYNNNLIAHVKSGAGTPLKPGKAIETYVFALFNEDRRPPDPRQVIALCKSKNIARLRIFKPNPGVLDALKNSGIELVLGTGNADLPALGRDPNFSSPMGPEQREKIRSLRKIPLHSDRG
ncbi:hypothetical protein L1049_024558 [Liquidambar formosana]|uniref:Dof-type domain-containing protein n=1 Tax=Liquidambar formosana TaxID=63359 RepID=A0AAP0WZQ6_LIQFO